jgi:tungstate transport system substrate-binding protein
LDVLVPQFTAKTGIQVKVIAVGTGQALQIGRRGDADVLLVHDPTAEARFMADGHGSLHRDLMHNDFILVGPAADPAKIRGQTSVVAALERVARAGVPFVSRGDESGTHQKERALWKQAGIQPEGDWYIAAGTGMGQVLRMANEKHAYTLSDRGTYLAQHRGLDLEIFCEKDPLLFNPYSVIVINPARHANVHARAAEQFAQFLLSPQTQQTIAEFGKAQYGQPLFFPHQAAR